MSRTILIVGAGQGLGQSLFQELDIFDKTITVSRSGPAYGDIRITCSANELKNNVEKIENQSIEAVVYIPSAWGESRSVKLTEFKHFMQNGPEGLLATFEAVKARKLLRPQALFVSIGSISSEMSTSVYSGLNNPVYAISKLSQKAVVAQLVRVHKNYRFATITLGSIGDNEQGVGYSNISRTIKYLWELERGVRYCDIEIAANSDIQ